MKKTLSQLISYYLRGEKNKQEQQEAKEKALEAQRQQEQERRYQKWLKQVAIDTTPEKLQETGTATIIDLIKDAKFCYMKGDEYMTFREVFLGDTCQILYYIDMGTRMVFSVQNDNVLQHCFTIPSTQNGAVKNVLQEKRKSIKTQRAYYDFISSLPKQGIVNQR